MARTLKDYNDGQLKMMVKTCGKKLKSYRESKGLSQSDLSLESGVAASSISEIESLKVNDLKLSTISALARVLDVSPEALLRPSDLQLSKEDRKAFKQALSILKSLDSRMA